MAACLCRQPVWRRPATRSRTVDLLPGDALNVNDPLAAVDGHNLAFPALEVATHNLHLVVLADRHSVHLQSQARASTPAQGWTSGRQTRTWCFLARSLLSGDDMITRRTELGAVKCALRLFLRLLETFGLNFILLTERAKSAWRQRGSQRSSSSAETPAQPCCAPRQPLAVPCPLSQHTGGGDCARGLRRSRPELLPLVVKSAASR